MKHFITKRMREQEFGKESEDVLLIVVAVSGHCGLVVFHEGRIGSLRWGNALNCPQPKGLLGMIYELLITAYHLVKCSVNDGDIFIVDPLVWEKKKDGYGCGLYCIASMRRFCTSASKVPRVG